MYGENYTHTHTQIHFIYNQQLTKQWNDFRSTQFTSAHHQRFADVLMIDALAQLLQCINNIQIICSSCTSYNMQCWNFVLCETTPTMPISPLAQTMIFLKFQFAQLIARASTTDLLLGCTIHQTANIINNGKIISHR